MNPARKPPILRIAVVVFAISLLAGYVVFSQTRAKPRVTHAPSSKLGLVQARLTDIGQVGNEEEEEVVQIVPTENAQALEGIAVLGTKSGAPLIPPRMIRLETGNPWSGVFMNSGVDAQQLRPAMAPGSKTLIHVIPPSTLDSLLQKQPADNATPEPKDNPPILPQRAIVPQSSPAPPAVLRAAPGSKSKVPLIRVEHPANSPAQQQLSR